MMTKQEILKELETLVDPEGIDFDGSQFIIIGKAADILNGKDDPTMKDIEIWVDPAHYDRIASGGEYAEIPTENGHPARNISFAYFHYEKKYGAIKLYRGDIIDPEPRSRKIEGWNVQIPVQEAATALISNSEQK